VARPAWLSRLDAEQATVVALALTGFYKEAGVDLIREQIEASFAPACPPYDIRDDGLVVWPGRDFATEAVYDLQQRPEIRARVVAGEPRGEWPVLRAEQLVFRNRAFEGSDWVGPQARVPT